MKSENNPSTSKILWLTTIISAVTAAASIYGIVQTFPQYTTDAVIGDFTASSEPEIWRANIPATFINSGNRQSFISRVSVLYASPDPNQFSTKCSRNIEIYSAMDLITAEGKNEGVVVPSGGTMSAIYSFEAKKEVSNFDMAFPYELCIKYQAVGARGKPFNELRYIGEYLVYNDRVEMVNLPDEPRDPVRIIPKKSIVELGKEYLFGG